MQSYRKTIRNVLSFAIGVSVGFTYAITDENWIIMLGFFSVVCVIILTSEN